MQVSFAATADEIARGNFELTGPATLESARAMRRKMLRSLGMAVAIIWLVLAYRMWKQPAGGRFTFINGAIAGIGVVLSTTAASFIRTKPRQELRLQHVQLMRKSIEEGRFGRVTIPRTISLEEDAIVEADDDGYVARYWARITAVDTVSDLVVIRSAPGSGWFVPRRAFASPAEESAFIAEINRRRVIASPPALPASSH